MLKKHKTLVAILTLATVVIGLTVFGVNSNKDGNVPTNNAPTHIALTTAYQHYQSGKLMLDVRELGEWQDGHVTNASHIPLGQLSELAAQSLPDLQQPIVIYCVSGRRAQAATEQLKAMGYSNVNPMAGGYSDWHSAGYPTTSTE